MIKKILQSPHGQKISQRYSTLSSSDQWAVKLLLLFLIIVLVISVIWLPSQRVHQKAHDYWEEQKNLLSWMQEKSLAISNTAQVKPDKAPDKQNLLTLVTNSAKQYQLSINRLQPEEDHLRVWLEQTDFNKTLRWLEFLAQEHMVDVEEASIEKLQEKPGMANIRLVLGRNVKE